MTQFVKFSRLVLKKRFLLYYYFFYLTLLFNMTEMDAKINEELEICMLKDKYFAS